MIRFQNIFGFCRWMDCAPFSTTCQNSQLNKTWLEREKMRYIRNQKKPAKRTVAEFKKEVPSLGLPVELNQHHLLLNLPDYTFLDGRPTPYGSKQKMRIEKQKNYTARILQLTSEIDVALDLHKKREAAKKNAIEERLAQKLKEKGNKTIEQ